MKTYTRREAMIRMLEMPGHKMKSKSVVFHFCDECNKFMLHDRDVADMSSPYWSEEFTDYTEPFKLDFDWSLMPKYCRSITMDENEDWNGHYQDPYKMNHTWDSDEHMFLIPIEYAPKNYTGDWKDSLFERPEE